MPRPKSQDADFFPVGRPKIVTEIATAYLALKFNPPLVDRVIECVLKQQLRIIPINHELQLIM